jgi:hypothetical protein
MHVGILVKYRSVIYQVPLESVTCERINQTPKQKGS